MYNKYKRCKMDKIQSKENRYNLIVKSLQNRIFKLREDLSYNLRCKPEEIDTSEWESYIDDHLKRPLNDLWGDEDIAYYLFDKLIEETAHIPSYPSNRIKKILNDWQI